MTLRTSLTLELGPISYNDSITYKNLQPQVNSLTFQQSQLTDYETFRSGKTATDWTSSVLRACSKIAARFSMSQRATPAISLCAAPSSHSSFARFRCWLDRESAASSNSPSAPSEHSSKYDNGGRFIKRAFGPGGRRPVLPALIADLSRRCDWLVFEA